MSRERERARALIAEFLRRPAKSPDYEANIEAARRWLVAVGLELNKKADHHNDMAAFYLDKVGLICFCAELPGDWPLRVRLTPDVFNLQA